ncbi:hypothetical protein Tco_0897248 [Tanacetum coccineum]
MEMIHVNFDELTPMASECNNSEPRINYMNFLDSSEDSQSVPSKTDLDNLFVPLYEEYYETSSLEVSDNVRLAVSATKEGALVFEHHKGKCPGVLVGDTYDGYILFSLCPGVLGGNTHDGNIFFYYCPGVLEGNTYDGYTLTVP